MSNPFSYILEKINENYEKKLFVGYQDLMGQQNWKLKSKNFNIANGWSLGDFFGGALLPSLLSPHCQVFEVPH